jgi:predicted AAA+ superfamily ATPase
MRRKLEFRNRFLACPKKISFASYVEVLEDLLLGFRVPIFTRRAKRQTAAHPKIYYWRTRSGVEVDFVVYGEAGFWAIEVKNTRRVRPEEFRGGLSRVQTAVALPGPGAPQNRQNPVPARGGVSVRSETFTGIHRLRMKSAIILVL